MQRVWKVKDLLTWTTRYFLDRSIQEPRLEAELLLAHVLKKDRVYLYTNYEQPVNSEEREIYREIIKRKAQGEPTAYITGHKEFMSLNFVVNSSVLIPRPDTETLVETAISISQADNVKRICDVGTGSGAIAVSLAVYLPDTNIIAVDISPEALQVARDNADRHEVHIQFRAGNLLEPISVDEEMDMIVANLPYIPNEEIDNLEFGVKGYEPVLALAAPGDGLDLYRRLLPQAYELLRAGGYLLIEIDPRQAKAALEMMQYFSESVIIPDWAGRNRVIKARKPVE